MPQRHLGNHHHVQAYRRITHHQGEQELACEDEKILPQGGVPFFPPAKIPSGQGRFSEHENLTMADVCVGATQELKQRFSNGGASP